MRIYFSFFNVIFCLLFYTNYSFSDSFNNNFYNNHGTVGLINIPTSRFFNEGSHGITVYDGTPDQKVTLSSNPYDWLEASFFYTNIQGTPYPGYEYQDYKDKGFNIKARLKKEGYLPAISIGLSDFAGTGYYSSEYIVSSYGINNIDMHFGIGWGQLSGSNTNIKNPLGYFSDSFKTRPVGFQGQGGSFNPDQYFSGKEAATFYGISYKLKNNLFLNVEKDTILVDGPRMPYPKRKSDYSIGFKYQISSQFSVGASFERGSYTSLRFVYKNNPKSSLKKYEYQRPDNIKNDDDKYTKLIKNLEENGIGVNKITETSRAIGLELTQFIHPDIRLVEEIIKESTRDAGINKEIKKDIKIADLDAVSEIDEPFKINAKTIYERDKRSFYNTNTGLRFQPFLASREEFFKGALLVENNTEFIIRDNLFFNTNLKYSLWNNFDDFRFGPIDIYPAQVRSDVKEYLKNINEGVLIGRAQLDYYITPKFNHHIMFSGGILEDMFSGFGAEYLYFVQDTNYAFGMEVFNVRKRDYDWGFGHLEYKNTIAHANFYYRNFGSIPFDMKISAGEYLAGDVGSTIEFSRSFNNGIQFGVFATFTDVSSEQFGEGSFDKGLFFNIPVYGNFINYTWRPLTKDPGAKLIRRNSLHDLLVRFKPIE